MRRDQVDILMFTRLLRYIGDMTAPMIARFIPINRTVRAGRDTSRTQTEPARAHSASLAAHSISNRALLQRSTAKACGSFQTTAWDQESLGHFAAIAISGYVREQMIRSGYATEGIHVLHNQLRTRTHHANSGRRPAIRVHRSPGALKGCRRCCAHFIGPGPAHLDIAGDGTQFEQLRKLALTLGLADSVTFHGWLDPEGVNDLIDKSRASFFPSTWPNRLAWSAWRHRPEAVPLSHPRGWHTGVRSRRVDCNTRAAQRSSTLAAAITSAGNGQMSCGDTWTEGRQYAGEHFSLDDHILRLAALYDGAFDIIGNPPKLTIAFVLHGTAYGLEIGSARTASRMAAALSGRRSAAACRAELHLHPTPTTILADLLVSTPLFEALRTRFPAARIVAGIGDWNRPILQNNPYVTEVLSSTRRG